MLSVENPSHLIIKDLFCKKKKKNPISEYFQWAQFKFLLLFLAKHRLN